MKKFTLLVAVLMMVAFAGAGCKKQQPPPPPMPPQGAPGQPACGVRERRRAAGKAQAWMAGASSGESLPLRHPPSARKMSKSLLCYGGVPRRSRRASEFALQTRRRSRACFLEPVFREDRPYGEVSELAEGTRLEIA